MAIAKSFHGGLKGSCSTCVEKYGEKKKRLEVIDLKLFLGKYWNEKHTLKLDNLDPFKSKISKIR